MDWTNKRKVAAQIMLAFFSFMGSYALFMPAASRLKMAFVSLCGTAAVVGYAYTKRHTLQAKSPN
jgi:1,4-dihydroxy-2-naphthoate octaprenyltransferase